jgi:hypothetical protein
VVAAPPVVAWKGTKGERQMAGTKQHPAPDRQVQHDPYGHGHSVAAWTAVCVVMLGALLMSVAVALGWDATWLFVVGVVVVALGPVAGKILGALGFGSRNRSSR